MIEITDKAACCGCSSCASACPLGCISMETDKEGFSYPHVDFSRCVGCGSCDEACPFANPPKSSAPLATYAAKTTDKDIRLLSSSGGVFTELSKATFARGGVVYGVVMSSDCRSCFSTRAESEEELRLMRGSKYLQACTEGIFEKVKADIEADRKVLFSGTPCQANALNSFLKGKRDNLLIVDCVCHGVPSPRLWAECVDAHESKRGASVQSVRFRCKEDEWRVLSQGAEANSIYQFESLDTSPYLKLFLRNYCLRPSCYECRAKESRAADITVADFWGVEKMLPEFDDGLGISLVIARTERGVEAFGNSMDSLLNCEVSYEESVKNNSAEYSSVLRPSVRDDFFDDLEGLGYEGVVSKYVRLGAKGKAKRLLKRALSAIDSARGNKKRMSYGILITYNPR